MFKIAEELSELPAYEDEEYDKPESFLKVLFFFFFTTHIPSFLLLSTFN